MELPISEERKKLRFVWWASEERKPKDKDSFSGLLKNENLKIKIHLGGLLKNENLKIKIRKFSGLLKNENLKIKIHLGGLLKNENLKIKIRSGRLLKIRKIRTFKIRKFGVSEFPKNENPKDSFMNRKPKFVNTNFGFRIFEKSGTKIRLVSKVNSKEQKKTKDS
ncbi:unnamed protein product [Rhizophagus irregularis]|nr:unnamed protein product [Rhizophagus irregularis]